MNEVMRLIQNLGKNVSDIDEKLSKKIENLKNKGKLEIFEM
jgi:hypothetical protein